MSYIPNNAMPHAMAEDETDEHRSIIQWLSDAARDNPKKAIGAGALVLAGAAIAAAVPFIAPSRPKATTKRKSRARGKANGASARSRGNGASAPGDDAKPKRKATRAKASGAGAGRKRANGRRRRSRAEAGPAS